VRGLGWRRGHQRAQRQRRPRGPRRRGAPAPSAGRCARGGGARGGVGAATPRARSRGPCFGRRRLTLSPPCGTQDSGPEPPAAAATACAPARLCPVTLALRPAALEAEFHVARGRVAASYDRWSLPVSSVHIFGLLVPPNTLLDGAGGARHRLQVASVAAMAAAALGARAWLWRSPASYARHREAHMAAHRALRAVFLLVCATEPLAFTRTELPLRRPRPHPPCRRRAARPPRRPPAHPIPLRRPPLSRRRLARLPRPVRGAGSPWPGARQARRPSRRLRSAPRWRSSIRAWCAGRAGRSGPAASRQGVRPSGRAWGTRRGRLRPRRPGQRRGAPRRPIPPAYTVSAHPRPPPPPANPGPALYALLLLGRPHPHRRVRREPARAARPRMRHPGRAGAGRRGARAVPRRCRVQGRRAGGDGVRAAAPGVAKRLPL
jgi:hypothetical protein